MHKHFSYFIYPWSFLEGHINLSREVQSIGKNILLPFKIKKKPEDHAVRNIPFGIVSPPPPPKKKKKKKKKKRKKEDYI